MRSEHRVLNQELVTLLSGYIMEGIFQKTILGGELLKTYFFLLLILLSINLLAQENTEKLIQPTIGLIWRSTAHPLSTYDDNTSSQGNITYNTEEAVQGFGISTGLLWNISNYLTIEYTPTFRYDYAKGEKFQGRSQYEFILDHNLNIVITSSQINYGIGWSRVNAGKSFLDNDGIKHQASFSTYNALAVFRIKKIFHLEVKVMYIPENYPDDRTKEYMAYSLRLYRILNFKRET